MMNRPSTNSTTDGNAFKKSTDNQNRPMPEFDEAMARDFAALLLREEGCLELRAIGNKAAESFADRTTYVGFFDSPEELARAAKIHHGKRALYVGLNPRQTDLLAVQPPNRLIQAQQGGKAENILAQQVFAIDIDPAKPDPRLASSEIELHEAQCVFDKINSFLQSRNISPITADSGNGKHLLILTPPYPKNDREKTEAELSLLLRWFDRNFSSKRASVDTGVGDAARVWKLYGTVSIKGANTFDRPWRKATFQLPSPPQGFVDVLALFENEIKEQRLKEERKHCKPSRTSSTFSEDRPLAILNAIKDQGLWLSDAGHGKHFLKCPWANEHSSGVDGDGSTAYFDGSTKGPGFKCLHSHCLERNLGDLMRFLGIVPEAPVREKSKLAFVKLGDLLKKPDEKIDWLVDEMLPMAGISIMGAKPKAGKTTLCRQLCLAVARGTPFLGRKTAPGPVFVLALEEKEQEIKKHFKDQGADGSEQIYVHSQGTPDSLVQVLEQEILEKKPVLLIIDTLFRVLDVEDGNAYAAMVKALTPFQDLARRTGVHLMVVHHMGKSREREGADGLLGSTAIFGSVDTAIILDRKKDNKRTIRTDQRYGLNLEESELEFDPVTRTMKIVSSVKESAARNAETMILDFVRGQREEQTAAQIEEGCSMHKQRRLAATKQLVQDGKLLVSGEGKRGDPIKFRVNPSLERLIPEDK